MWWFPCANGYGIAPGSGCGLRVFGFDLAITTLHFERNVTIPMSAYSPDVSLPNRPIQVSPKAVARPRLGIFATIVLFTLGVGLTIWQAPGIWRDMQLKSNGVHTNEFRIESGDCTTRNVVFTSCDAHFYFVPEAAEEIYEAKADFMFLDWGSEDYLVDVVYAPDDPAKATLSLGVDKLWNRALTWGAFAVLLIGGGVIMVFQFVRTASDRRALREPGLLGTVPVEIKNIAQSRNATFITYARKTTGKRLNRNHFTKLAKGQEALIMQGADGKPFGLAVTHPGTTTPVLLDQGLTHIDLTDAERAEFFAQLRGQ